MLASRLVIDGDTTWARVTIGLGNLGGSCSPDFNLCKDLLRARVGFIVRASESLLSEGRRLLSGGACVAPRGNGDGQRRFRGTSRDDKETWELLRDSILGRLKVELWLLSVRVSSELVFLFSTTSPPAMMTGAILSIKNESWDRLPRLSCEDMVPGMTRVVLVTLLLRRRTEPSFPYPSWPVPAAGPFLDGLSFFSC
jgi:hypothetical protein